MAAAQGSLPLPFSPLAELRKVRQLVERLETLMPTRDRLILDALVEGHSMRTVATAAGLTSGGVSQIKSRLGPRQYKAAASRYEARRKAAEVQRQAAEADVAEKTKVEERIAQAAAAQPMPGVRVTARCACGPAAVDAGDGSCFVCAKALPDPPPTIEEV